MRWTPDADTGVLAVEEGGGQAEGLGPQSKGQMLPGRLWVEDGHEPRTGRHQGLEEVRSRPSLEPPWE